MRLFSFTRKIYMLCNEEKEVYIMLLFILLMVALLGLIVTGALLIGAGGAVFLIVFGDVIACLFIIVCIVKHFRKRR